MSDKPVDSWIAELVKTLPAKTKQPNSANVLTKWITLAEDKLGTEVGGGRLGWLIASAIAIAAVQRAIDPEGRQLFLLKGGTLLQHRLTVPTRTTHLSKSTTALATSSI